MASLFPSFDVARRTAANAREVDVLERLAEALPDGYEIFHSVTWHSVLQDADRHGEIDLVVLDPRGRIALLEVKAGDVSIRNGYLYKLYSSGEKDVGRQSRVQYSAIVERLDAAGLRAHVTNLIVLPDFTVGDEHIVAVPRERIIDATGFDMLGTHVREALDGGRQAADRDALHRFLANEFRVAPDLRVLGAQLRSASVCLADGLATWVPRIQAPGGVIRIQATAGSGKTQLALRLLGDAAELGKRSLYACFNRSLADHMGRIASTRAKVASFHELCVDHRRKTAGEPDFGEEGIYDRLASAFCEAAQSFEPGFELIVIDEGQDFKPEWVEALIAQLKPEGRLYLMEDAAQRLYERDEFDLEGAVHVSCADNFRSPRVICQLMNALRLSEHPVIGRGPFDGDVPGFRIYEGERDLVRQTAAAVNDLVARGIPVEGIAVLSARGMSGSVLLHADRIGDYGVCRFTGKYSSDGEPLWSEGELLLESVYRFKGQSALAVVMSEIDFAELGERERRKLFVGLTRAHVAVELVMSPQADVAIRAALGL